MHDQREPATKNTRSNTASHGKYTIKYNQTRQIYGQIQPATLNTRLNKFSSNTILNTQSITASRVFVLVKIGASLQCEVYNGPRWVKIWASLQCEDYNWLRWVKLELLCHARYRHSMLVSCEYIMLVFFAWLHVMGLGQWYS